MNRINLFRSSSFHRLVTYGKFLVLLLGVYLFVLAPVSKCQFSGVQPTSVPGSNSVLYDASTYKFFHNKILRYEYSILPETTPNGGTFNVLRAYADNLTSFLPSNYGGIRAILSGEDKAPWHSGISFLCLNHQILPGDTVLAYWQMFYNGDSIKYKYKFKIVGRTLVIRVEIDDAYSNKVISLDLDRCEEGQNPEAIAVPYLSLFHILFSNDIFTSFFADWEISNASQIVAWDGSHYPYNNTSVRYAQIIKYNHKTNNSRNRMLETLYLSTSPNLEDVFPNIPNPMSPYKEVSANQIVWDYRRPFARLIRQSGQSWNYLQRLWNAGVTNIWVQIHDWQQHHGNPWYSSKSGYDDGLPCVLPANETDEKGSEYGGKPVLDSVISRAHKYGYRIGLHQNYIDYYPNAMCFPYGYQESDIALDPNGVKIKAHYHNYNDASGVQSYLLKPSKVSEYISYWSSSIQAEYPKLNGCYLDVHSSIGPATNYVDYHDLVPNAGMFRETIQRYRELFSILRTNHNGPVQGEGGNECLFLGYVDDTEARIRIPMKFQPGYEFPLLVDFDLLKLRSKTMVHGVGWYPLWKGIDNPRATYDEVLSYIATELAYGHGAYLCDEFDVDVTQVDFIQHAQLKHKYVFSVQRDYANASPTQILYNNNGSLKSASEFIRIHPVTYKDITSDDFMSQVKIVYDNGMIVCVNRHPDDEWEVNIGISAGWFNYHTTTELETGFCLTTTFTLPPRNGWVVYDPMKNKPESFQKANDKTESIPR